MGMNCGYGCSKPGILKIVTIVIGAIIWIWMGTVVTSAYYFTEPERSLDTPVLFTEKQCEEGKERAEKGGSLNEKQAARAKAPCPKKWFVQTAFGFAFFIFVGSIIALLLLLCVELNKNGLFNQIDFIGHFVAGFLLVVAAILSFAYVAMVYGKIDCSELEKDSLSIVKEENCNEVVGKNFAPIGVAICGALLLVNGIVYYVLGVVIQKAKT